MKMVVIAGARPNFVKIAPLIKEMRRYPSMHPVFIHTGQHYDQVMSDQFLMELELQPPDINLGVGSRVLYAATHGRSAWSLTLP